jgi:hypothetical protein
VNDGTLTLYTVFGASIVIKDIEYKDYNALTDELQTGAVSGGTETANHPDGFFAASMKNVVAMTWMPNESK